MMSKMYWIKIKEEIFKITKKEFVIINALENSNNFQKDEIIKRFNNIRGSSTAIKNTNKYVYSLNFCNKIYAEWIEEQKNRSNY